MAGRIVCRNGGGSATINTITIVLNASIIIIGRDCIDERIISYWYFGSTALKEVGIRLDKSRKESVVGVVAFNRFYHES